MTTTEKTRAFKPTAQEEDWLPHKIMSLTQKQIEQRNRKHTTALKRFFGNKNTLAEN
jgi:hypothetical protein